MEADARTLGQGVALDETKPRVETRPIASESASVKATQTLDFKFWTAMIGIIGAIVTTIVGIVMITNASNERINTLETNLNARLDATNERIDGTNKRIDGTNERIDTLGRDLNARLDGTNERIDATNKRLDATNERLDKLR